MSGSEIIASLFVLGVAGYAYWQLGPRDDSGQGPHIPPIPGFPRRDPLLPKGFKEPTPSTAPTFGPSTAPAPTVVNPPDLGVGTGSAQPLIDLIHRAEAGARGYDSYYSAVKLRPPKRVTSMTLNEVQQWQRDTVAAGSVSSAVGMYQIITATLSSLKSRLNLSGNERFDKALQDRLGLSLMEGRGLRRYQAGTMNLRGFGNSLAREWAGLPVLSDQQGHKVRVKRGDSYYAAFAGNKATVSATQFEAALRRMKG